MSTFTSMHAAQVLVVGLTASWMAGSLKADEQGDLAAKLHSAAAEGKGYMGLSVDYVSPAVRAQTSLEDGFGLSIVFVVPGGPGHNAGLKRYDVLAAFDDQRLASPATLSALASEKSPGDQVMLTVLRRGASTKMPLVLGDLRDAPETAVQAANGARSEALVNSLIELFRRTGGVEGIDVTTNEDGDMRLEWNDSMSGLLSDLRKHSNRDGIRLRTLEIKQSTTISTSELNIVITSQGLNERSWISAHRKDGDVVFQGYLDKNTPLELRNIIEETDGMHQSFPASAEGGR